MPEMHFRVRWPDGSPQRCYSPSLVVEDYLQPGETYTLDDFVERSRLALEIASERVRERYGFACTSAAAQITAIEQASGSFRTQPDPLVRVEAFER